MLKAIYAFLVLALSFSSLAAFAGYTPAHLLKNPEDGSAYYLLADDSNAEKPLRIIYVTKDGNQRDYEVDSVSRLRHRGIALIKFNYNTMELAIFPNSFELRSLSKNDAAIPYGKSVSLETLPTTEESLRSVGLTLEGFPLPQTALVSSPTVPNSTLPAPIAASIRPDSINPILSAVTDAEGNSIVLYGPESSNMERGLFWLPKGENKMYEIPLGYSPKNNDGSWPLAFTGGSILLNADGTAIVRTERDGKKYSSEVFKPMSEAQLAEFKQNFTDGKIASIGFGYFRTGPQLFEVQGDKEEYVYTDTIGFAGPMLDNKLQYEDRIEVFTGAPGHWVKQKVLPNRAGSPMNGSTVLLLDSGGRIHYYRGVPARDRLGSRPKSEKEPVSTWNDKVLVPIEPDPRILESLGIDTNRLTNDHRSPCEIILLK